MNTILNSQEDAHYKRGSAKNSDKRRRFSLPLTSYWRYGLSLLALTYNLTPLAFPHKTPLDHEVYDGWQSISSANISKNGKYVYLLVSPREDGSKFCIQHALSLPHIGEMYRASNVSL